jgi:hypothetical protein
MHFNQPLYVSRNLNGRCSLSTTPRIAAAPVTFDAFNAPLAHLQELLALPALSDTQAELLLHHVLLWQYLKHRNIMDLVSLALSQKVSPAAETRRRASRRSRGDGSCFLTTLGVPLIRAAMDMV